MPQDIASEGPVGQDSSLNFLANSLIWVVLGSAEKQLGPLAVLNKMVKRGFHIRLEANMAEEKKPDNYQLGGGFRFDKKTRDKRQSE